MWLSYDQIVTLIRGAGKEPAERDSLYQTVRTFEDWVPAEPAVRPQGPEGPTFQISHRPRARARGQRSEEHTSELQSPVQLVCRLLLEQKKLDNGAGGPALGKRCRMRVCAASGRGMQFMGRCVSVYGWSRRRRLGGLVSRYGAGYRAYW